MNYDPTITLGNIITLVCVVFGAIGVAMRLSTRLQRIEDRVGLMWRWFKKVHHLNGDSEPNDRDHRAA